MFVEWWVVVVVGVFVEFQCFSLGGFCFQFYFMVVVVVYVCFYCFEQLFVQVQVMVGWQYVYVFDFYVVVFVDVGVVGDWIVVYVGGEQGDLWVLQCGQ